MKFPKFTEILRKTEENIISMAKSISPEKINRYDILALASMLAYGIIFSYYTILKHYTFYSYAWDLGIFNQALYTTLFHGKLLYYTADQFLNPSNCYLAFHFSPILFILLPFYGIYPQAETLLVIKSFLLAFGGLPLYFLAKETLKSNKAALMLTIAYLLHPAIQGSNWFDFQQQVFIPILTFSSAYFLIKEKWKPYFFTLTPSLMISEHTTLLVLTLSVYYLLTSNLRRIPHLIKKPQITRETAITLTVVLCIIFLYVSEYVKGLFPIQSEFLGVYKATGAYNVLGFKEGSLISLMFYALLNPVKSLEALLYDYLLKLLYILILFAPLAFLSFGSKMTLFTAFLLAPFLLSNYPAYYEIGAHYPLYVITPVFLAAIETLSKRTKQDIEGSLKVALVASLVIIISVSPISPMSNPLIEKNALWYPSMGALKSEDIQDTHRIIELIPKNASVLTQNNLFPHLSSRINAYVLPLIGGSPEQINLLKDYANQLINKSDYILLNIKSEDRWTIYVFNEVEKTSSFGLYALSKQVLLFKRNYSGPTLRIGFSEEEIFKAYEDLYVKPSAKILVDESSISGSIVLYPKKSKEDIFVYGPYIPMPKGTYNVTCVIMVGPHGEGYLGTFDVVDSRGERYIARKNLYGFEMDSNVWRNITLTFAVSDLRNNVEFRVSSNGAADVYVDCIILKQLSSEAESDFGTLTFNYVNLKFNGKLTEERTLLRAAESEEEAWSFWFGPYISLPPGNYSITVNLRVSPNPNMEDKIIVLDVSMDYGGKIIARTSLYGKDVVENQSTSGWCGIKLKFNAETLIKAVEFRGVEPSKAYNIYLSYILLEKTG